MIWHVVYYQEWHIMFVVINAGQQYVFDKINVFLHHIVILPKNSFRSLHKATIIINSWHQWISYWYHWMSLWYHYNIISMLTIICLMCHICKFQNKILRFKWPYWHCCNTLKNDIFKVILFKTCTKNWCCFLNNICHVMVFIIVINTYPEWSQKHTKMVVLYSNGYLAA